MVTDERIETFHTMCEKMNFNLTDDFDNWLQNNGFFTAPASTKYHGAYEGGLFDHSLAVTKRLVTLSVDNKLEWTRKESPFIVGMFHDLCKCDQYIKTEGSILGEINDTLITSPHGYHYEYNKDTILKGHGAKSVMLLSQFITLTEEEVLCIRYHMGAYEKEEWAEFDAAIRNYETCLWTHMADMLASKIDNT